MGQKNKKSQRQKITLIEMPSPAQLANSTEAPDEETEENDEEQELGENYGIGGNGGDNESPENHSIGENGKKDGKGADEE